MRKMLMLFIETIPPTIAKMVDHFKMGEMDTISSLAHKIKPTLNGVGIVILKEVIRNIEDYRERKRTTVQLEDDIESLQKIITGIVLEFEKEILLLKNNPE